MADVDMQQFSVADESIHPVERLTETPNGQIVKLPLDTIEPDPSQPRSTFAEPELRQLADSIRVHGLLQAISVRRDGGSYKIVAGERRWRAHKLAGLPTVNAVVLNIEPTAAYELSLIENIQRENLTPFEEATGICRLMNSRHYSQREVGPVVGRSESHISKLMSLSKIKQDLIQKLSTSKVGLDQLYQVARQPTPRKQARLAKKILDGNLSTQQARKAAKPRNQPIEVQTENPAVKKVKSLKRGLSQIALRSLKESERVELKSELAELIDQARKLHDGL